MVQVYDGIVIGAGVMGASAAMHLASGGMMKRLLVLEKGPAAGSGSTGKSSACIRQTYSHFEVSLMAYEALQLFKHWQEFTGLRAPRANFVNCGVLLMLGKDDESLPQVLDIHKRIGIDSAVLDARQKRAIFPDVDFAAPPADRPEAEPSADFEVTALHEREGGFADPLGTAEDMLEVARGLGAEVRFNARVTKVLQEGGRTIGVEAVIGGNKETLYAPVVVNCAGPWAPGLNASAGHPLAQKLVPTRIQMVSKQFTEQLKGPIPMVVDMVNGFYGRLEASGGQILVGSVREQDEREVVADPDDYNEVADAPFREEMLTLLHHRVTTFRTRGNVTSYAGLYTVNRDDYHPIIDESELKGFYPVCGFSGHGFKLSPVVGALVAKLVTGQWGRARTDVPLDFFRKHRTPLKTNWGGVMA